MRARLIKTRTLTELKRDVPKNLDKYRKGNFDELNIEGHCFELERATVEEADLATLQKSSKKTSIEEVDPQNAETVYNALNITPYLGKDARFWAYLCHVTCLEYSRTRWKISDDDEEAVKNIRTHFFTTDDRSFKRNNAMSRLWWDAYLAQKYSAQPISKTLKVLLYRTDVRAQIIDRTTSVNSTEVFSALIRLLTERYDAGDEDFFKRERNHDGPYRRLMRALNALGGQKLLDCMSPGQLDIELKNIRSII